MPVSVVGCPPSKPTTTIMLACLIYASTRCWLPLLAPNLCQYLSSAATTDTTTTIMPVCHIYARNRTNVMSMLRGRWSRCRIIWNGVATPEAHRKHHAFFQERIQDPRINLRLYDPISCMKCTNPMSHVCNCTDKKLRQICPRPFWPAQAKPATAPCWPGHGTQSSAAHTGMLGWQERPSCHSRHCRHLLGGLSWSQHSSDVARQVACTSELGAALRHGSL